MAIHLGPGKKRPTQERKGPFYVLEAGCGAFPHALVQKALKSGIVSRLNHRKFTGVDKRQIDINQILLEHGMGKVKNLQIIRDDILKTLDGLPANSQHVIFASFLLNNMGNAKGVESGIREDTGFIKRFKKALSPGGRIILIANKKMMDNYQFVADNLNMGFHSIEIKDVHAQNSEHLGIRRRGNPEARKAAYEIALKADPGTAGDAMRFMLAGRIKNPGDMFIPTILIFRKKRSWFVGRKGASSTSKSLNKAGK